MDKGAGEFPPVGKRTGRALASFLLLAFLVRSLIPAGFMPAADRPFTLEICPDGFPVHLLPRHADHVHPASDTGSDAGTGPAPGSSHHTSWSTHCAFAAIASAPPSAHPGAFALHFEVATLPFADADARVVTTTRFRIAQPRAPPLLAA